MPATSLDCVVGFTFLLKCPFNWAQTFSIGLRSGLSAGVFHQFIPVLDIISAAFLDVCLGSLSCWNFVIPGCRLKKGSNADSRMLIWKSASMFPVKMTMLVGPSLDIPAQT